MVTPAAVTDVDALVRDVDDPELPHVTIGDLGIVRSVDTDVASRVVRVALTPTYTGCPATEQIRDDVAAVVRDAGYEPEIEFAISPAWSSDWITERGRERLRAAGISPPSPASDPADPAAAVAVSVAAPVACPRCDSRRTRLVSQFGATACKASYVCAACSEPFEHFKAI